MHTNFQLKQLKETLILKMGKLGVHCPDARERAEPETGSARERAGNVSISICQFMHSIFRFLAISSFGFNRLSSKLVGMLFGIVTMFVPKDFVPDCFVAQICANSGAHAHFGAYLRDEAILTKHTRAC